MTCNAGGAAALLITPSYSYLAFAGSVSLGVATYTNSLVAGPTVTPANYRLVSIGIILRNQTTPLNSSGLVKIRGFADKTGTALASLDISTYNCDYYKDISLQNTNEVAVILKPLDITSQTFVTPASTFPSDSLAAWVSPGWGAVQISIVSGPVDTNALAVEMIFNYELSLLDSDTLALAATPSRPANSFVQDASSAVTKAVGSVFTNGVAAAGKAIERAAVRAVSTYFLGPSGGQAATQALLGN